MKGVGCIGYEKWDIPTPKSNEALIKLEYVGICGSDIHYYEHGAIGDYIVKPPFVLGHEASGVVVEIGNEVNNLKVGDRVALEPGKTCGHCEFCKQGLYNLCADVEFFATPPIDGVFLEYVAHDANLCFKLPDNVSTLEGALIEPLAVGFHSAGQGNAHIGQTAVVFGAGCIGLMSLLALKAMGVTTIFVIDFVDSRLQKAKTLGATVVLNGMNTDVVAEIIKLTNGSGIDLTIETSGSEKAAAQAINIAKKGSTIVMVGYSKSGQICMPMSDVLNKELTIKSVFRYRHRYPMSIDAVASKKINIKDVVTNVFEFNDIQQAMDLSVKDKQNIVKAVIKITS
jgi:L-iditol 2-dehydrogenase